MRIGKVIGTVTPGTIHPSLVGGQLKIVIPFTFEDLVGDKVIDEQTGPLFDVRAGVEKAGIEGSAQALVVYDELSAGVGEWIALSEGAEASMSFYPNNKPIDAYAAAILDTLEIDQRMLDQLHERKETYKFFNQLLINRNEKNDG